MQALVGLDLGVEIGLEGAGVDVVDGLAGKERVGRRQIALDRDQPPHQIAELARSVDSDRRTQGMADQDLRRFVLLLKPCRRGDQIVHVGREIGIGEIAFAAAQAREIEAQHRDPLFRKRASDVDRCLGIRGARKAVRKNGKRMGRSVG